MENIQVALRVRPINKKEIQRGEENVWSISNNSTISLYSNSYKDMIASKRINFSSRMSYPFDYCFSVEENNQHVYNTMVKRIALSSLNGINGTVFMYGQTGSGKTYTMMGYRQEETESTNFSQTHGNIPTSPRLRINNLKSPSKLDERGQSEMCMIDEGIGEFNQPVQLVTEINSSTGILVLALRDIFNTIENV